MTIELIEKELAVGQIPPHRLAEMRIQLSGMYSTLCGMLEQILEKKALRWMELRKDQTSDKGTDRAWDATPDGITEMKLRMRIKKMEKMMSAIKSLLDVAQGQAYNQY